MEVEIEGRTLQLLASRGVYLRESSTLLVADTHFGKEATFRRNQIAVPSGATDTTLGVIAAMLKSTAATRLVFLGDLFHASCSRSNDVMASLDRFFAEFAHVDMHLTLGNHDRRLGSLPSDWSLEIHKEMVVDGVRLAHHPEPVVGGETLLCCGHIHPAIRLSRATDRVGKLCCFWLSERQLILPAIGNFTGTQLVRPQSRDRVWVCAEGQVMAVTKS